MQATVMRKLRSTMCFIICGLFLTGCSYPSQPIHDSMSYSKLISKPNDNVLYDTIDLQYWLDNTTSAPVLVIISITTSHSPDGQLIGYSCGFDNGRCKYFRLTSGKLRRDIPFVEKDLVSSDRVPVYYTVDKPGIAKTSLAFDEFAQLQNAVKNQDFLKAKHIVTERVAGETQ